LLLVTGLLVAVGRYQAMENLIKVIVVLFTLLTLIATGLSLTYIDPTQPLSRPITLEPATLFFLIAITGWMPIGNVAAIMLSNWIVAKSAETGADRATTVRLDYNIGYLATTLLALCFVLIGTVFLLGNDQPIPGGSVGFAAMLIDLYSQILGGIAGTLIALAAFAVMFSTLISVLDGFPRIYVELFSVISRKPVNNPHRQQIGFLAALILGAALMLLVFMNSFTGFIDLVTTLGFLVAPVVVYLNERIMLSDQIDKSLQPSRALLAWNRTALVVFSATAIAYLALRQL
ncbi:MAG: hypothetical protein O3A63_09410, partial [Proteobacteria bacterium]|nr:hypothetical protein [Pseudomonadota bacterium]